MKIKAEIHGGSFAAGVAAMAVATHNLSAWWLMIIPVLFLDIPGPKIVWSKESGWKYHAWPVRGE